MLMHGDYESPETCVLKVSFYSRIMRGQWARLLSIYIEQDTESTARIVVLYDWHALIITILSKHTMCYHSLNSTTKVV